MSVVPLTYSGGSLPSPITDLVAQGLVAKGLIAKGPVGKGPVAKELPANGLVGRGHAPVGRAGERAGSTGGYRVLPIRPELSSLVPWGGLRRGATLAVAPDAPGATSLLLALVAEAVRTGSWCGVVGVPALGAGAAREQGVDLERLALVPEPGTEWVTVVAALLDGLDIVVVRPPGPVAPSLARRLAARVRQRSGVLVPFGEWPGADVTLRVADQVWHGLGQGRGRLHSRELTVVSSGRSAAARPRRTQLWLPHGPARAAGTEGAGTEGVGTELAGELASGHGDRPTGAPVGAPVEVAS